MRCLSLFRLKISVSTIKKQFFYNNFVLQKHLIINLLYYWFFIIYYFLLWISNSCKMMAQSNHSNMQWGSPLIILCINICFQFYQQLNILKFTKDNCEMQWCCINSTSSIYIKVKSILTVIFLIQNQQWQVPSIVLSCKMHYWQLVVWNKR